MKHALVTGTSSGFGHGLAEELLARGWRVHGCSRRAEAPAGVNHIRCDLTDAESVPDCLSTLLHGVPSLELVILNAGVLGRIQRLVDTPLEETKAVMETNLWANKTVMDWLHRWGRPVTQVIMISSGASILGNKGWGGYALSKAALNMLARLYAHEFPQSHISAVAPGIIDTPLMDHLCHEADAEAFPALKRLREARGSEAMPGPREAARRLLDQLEAIRGRPSGAFIDLRELTDPEAYARLYGRRP